MKHFFNCFFLPFLAGISISAFLIHKPQPSTVSPAIVAGAQTREPWVNVSLSLFPGKTVMDDGTVFIENTPNAEIVITGGTVSLQPVSTLFQMLLYGYDPTDERNTTHSLPVIHRRIEAGKPN